MTLCVASLAACSGDKSGSDGGTSTPAAEKLFPTNFEGVCSGASVSAATPYDKNAASHKALYFVIGDGEVSDYSSSLPQDWTVTFKPEGNAFKAIDLVACAKRTADKMVKVCEDYKVDGKPTKNKLRLHSATYELSVHEAVTGKQLGESKTLKAEDSTCPMFASFDGENETKNEYTRLKDAVVSDFLKPYVQP